MKSQEDAITSSFSHPFNLVQIDGSVTRRRRKEADHFFYLDAPPNGRIPQTIGGPAMHPILKRESVRPM
jgi:hypothetical protein